jgi:hypothetical protein
MDEDWRVDIASRHLKGQPLKRKKWTRWSEAWDHDHCAACRAKFSELDEPDIQKEGYATTESYKRGTDYDWVCVKCFSELKDKVGWYEIQ